MGKTALLDYAASQGEGCTVVRAVGVESEMELPFAALHQLCLPLLEGLERLPPPQRDALRTAFGLSSSARPDQFLVGLAVLTLLSDAAEGQPVICLVDDAQWLDRCSAQVLSFVARRLQAESVLMLFAERDQDQPTELAGLPELALQPLSDADARELLASSTPGPLDERVGLRIIAEARGNPLALLELPHGAFVREPRRRLCRRSFVAAHAPRGRKLSPPGRPATRGDATAAARRRGRTGRRSHASLASRRRARYSDRGGCAGGGSRPDCCRYTSHVSSSASSFGDLPRRSPERAAECTSRAGKRHGS